MKRKGMFLLFTVILLVLIGFVIHVIKNRAPKQGELKVESDPSASVFLDDKHIGRTPIGKTSFKVNTGEYLLKITPDSGINQMVDWQEKIKIGSNVLTYVNVTLSESELTTSSYVLWLEKISGKQGELYLTTTPDAATVLFDDEMKGTTPMSISDVEPGDHTITLVSRGFVTRTVKVRFNAGYKLIASVKLALSSGADISQEEASQSGSVQGVQTGNEGKATPTPKASSTPKPASSKTATGKYVLITETPNGFLRVRAEATTGSAELLRVKTGEKYGLLDTKDGWYEITVDASRSGWVSGEYSKIAE